MVDVVNDVIINYKSVGLDKVGSEIKQTSVSLDGLVVSATGADKATASLENRFKSLERSLGTTSGQQQKFEKIQRDINNAVAQNPALQDRANEALKVAEARYRATGAATGLARHELINLSRQAQDVAVSLYSGQSPLMVLAQQGTQIADVFASSGSTVGGAFRQMGASAAAFLTPVRLAIGGVVGLTAAAAALALQYDKVSVSSQRAISGAGARTGTTVGDLNNFVGQNSGVAASGLSNKEARQLGEGLTASGDIVISQLRGMSDAVVGFANQTGKSMDEAIKSFEKFGSDPKKALEELESVFGPVNSHVRDLVEVQSLAIDKTTAFQTVIDAFAEKSKKAAENLGFFEKAARAVVNVLATEATKPAGLEEQLAAVEKQISQGGFTPTGKLNDQRADLLNKISAESVQQVTAEINKMNTEAGRAQAQVAAIARSWGDVSVATALALNALQQQVSIAGAVTGQQQMAAQYAADFANASLQGKTAIEAKALASAKLAVSEAAATAAVERQIDALKDQNKMIKAQQNGTEATTAAAIAYKNAINSGADSTSAAALKAQTLANYLLQAGSAAVSLNANFDMLNASLNNFNAGMSQSLASAQAMAGSSISWQQGQSLGQQTFTDASGQVRNSGFDPIYMPSGTLDFTADPRYPVSYANGGPGKEIGPAVNIRLLGGIGRGSPLSPEGIASQYIGQGNYAGAIKAVQGMSPIGTNVGAQAELVDTLTQILNSQTADNGTKVANLQSEMAWLNTLPQTIARDQKIISLQQSIDQLKNSTDGLNSTMGDLLSPYYAQDPRTSKIGFRSQGMANGGYVDVPGAPSANDNMIATIPVASGERIYVDPMPSKRGGAGGGTSISISMPVTIQGNASKDEIGRTMYQVGQSLAKQLAGASR